jgi:hypothetical protein
MNGTTTLWFAAIGGSLLSVSLIAAGDHGYVSQSLIGGGTMLAWGGILYRYFRRSPG